MTRRRFGRCWKRRSRGTRGCTRGRRRPLRIRPGPGSVLVSGSAGAGPATAAAHPPVTRFDLDIWLGGDGSTPVASLHLDTRPDPESDGEWTHQSFAAVEFPHWEPDISAHAEGDGTTIDVTQLDGATVV